MVFGKKIKKGLEGYKPPGREQPDISLGAANFKDFLAPSFIKEVIPGDKNRLMQRSDDYYVEIGSTSEMVRYFRSFYAALTTSYTYAGMLNNLLSGDFGEADCDLSIHVFPTDNERTVWDLEQKIALKEVAYKEEPNPARKQSIIREIQDLQRQHINLVSTLKTYGMFIDLIRFLNPSQRLCLSLKDLRLSFNGSTSITALNLSPGNSITPSA